MGGRMTEITLSSPPHLADAIRRGQKTRTMRRKPHGNVGDIFYCRGVAYIITRIERERLIDAAYSYKEEGYPDVDTFFQDIHAIYPEIYIEILRAIMKNNVQQLISAAGVEVPVSPLTPEQQTRYEKRIQQAFPTLFYVYHFVPFGHLKLADVLSMPNATWGREEIGL